RRTGLAATAPGSGTTVLTTGRDEYSYLFLNKSGTLAEERVPSERREFRREGEKV
ncbi:hypothetical protein A2U01_0109018, partial [Trifolium medium]|nr:hypothetical protein [Trifolium medium]